MADPRTDYLDALREFRASTGALSEFVSLAARITSELSRTWDVDFGEMPELKYDPLRDASRRERERQMIDLKKWPTAEQIEAGVLDCRQKYAATKAAWDLVPEQDRTGLESLPRK